MSASSLTRWGLGPLNIAFGLLGVCGAALLMYEFSPSRLMRTSAFRCAADLEATFRALEDALDAVRATSRGAPSTPRMIDERRTVRDDASRLWHTALVYGCTQVAVCGLLAATGVLLVRGARSAHVLSKVALVCVPASALALYPVLGGLGTPAWGSIVDALQGAGPFSPTSALAYTVSILTLVWTFAYPLAGMLLLRLATRVCRFEGPRGRPGDAMPNSRPDTTGRFSRSA